MFSVVHSAVVCTGLPPSPHVLYVNTVRVCGVSFFSIELPNNEINPSLLKLQCGP